MDGSALLFQANFMGSNQSTAPDTDGATAICREISPLIGPTEKKRPPPVHCKLLLIALPPHMYKQLGLPINHRNDGLLRLTPRRTGLAVSDYFTALEQCVSVLSFKKKRSNKQGLHCQSVSPSEGRKRSQIDGGKE